LPQADSYLPKRYRLSLLFSVTGNVLKFQNVKGRFALMSPLQILGTRLHVYASVQLDRSWRICTAPLFIVLHTSTTTLISATWMCPSH